MNTQEISPKAFAELGYARYSAPPGSENDGDENCEVKLRVNTHDDASGIAHYTSYPGKTGKGNGHAEIDAIVTYLKTIGWDPAAFRSCPLFMECTSKPCCFYCSAVMGLLAIRPWAQTFKSTKRMGVSYGLPPQLRQFIAQFCNVPLKTVEQGLQVGWC
jgi:hypothetical protein